MSGEVNVIPTLRKFRGGPVEAFLGGASLRALSRLRISEFTQNFELFRFV